MQNYQRLTLITTPASQTLNTTQEVKEEIEKAAKINEANEAINNQLLLDSLIPHHALL